MKVGLIVPKVQYFSGHNYNNYVHVRVATSNITTNWGTALT